MGWAKYHEDNISRYWRDAKSQVRFPRSPVPGAVHVKNSPSKGDASVNIKSVMGEGKMMKEFTIAAAKPLPVIVLADVSGSMAENGKIEALNIALKDMIRTFAGESRLRADIQVGLITFGGPQATLHLPLAPCSKIADFPDLSAAGRTPMGHAFALAREVIEDRTLIPSRAYRPVVILVSDGLPTDDWEQPFEALCQSERTQKASRFALAIGSDADEDMLRRFSNNPEVPVFKAHEARDIHRFFRAVTMSVTTRTASANPDSALPLTLGEIPEDGELDLDFK